MKLIARVSLPGFVLEGLAFFQIYKGGRLWQTPARKAEAIANIFVVVAGIFVLVGGAYSSISAIKYVMFL